MECTVRSVWLCRLLRRRSARITFADGIIRIESDPAHDGVAFPIEAICEIAEQRSWLWTCLTIRTRDGAAHSIDGLSKRSVALVSAAVSTHLATLLRSQRQQLVENSRVRRRQAVALLTDDQTRRTAQQNIQRQELTDRLRGDANRLAQQLGEQLLGLDERLDEALSGARYLRHSEGARLQQQSALLLELAELRFMRMQLTREATDALERIQRTRADSRFERERADTNERYVSATVPAVHAASAPLIKNALTDEQAKAIATDEDATLVLAGAGTGKTSAITGKIAHLIHNQGVNPDEILVLAFNKKAADEIEERVNQTVPGVRVSTFNAFGLRVIAEASGKSPRVSRLARDEDRLLDAIERILSDLAHDPSEGGVLGTFIVSHRLPYSSVFDFERLSDYYDYVRRTEFVALSGDKVKSFEELEIANFLACNGIRFTYEGDYQVETATSRYRQYQPDFHLPDYDLYIEHFALDERGRPPPNWPRYGDGVAWKRRIHRQHGTTLIETHSAHRRQGSLLEHLRRELEAHGVTFQTVPLRDLFHDLKRLKSRVISHLARLLATFIHHIKAAAISIDQLRARSATLPGLSRSQAFLNLLEQVWNRYQSLLSEENAIDFADQINHAVPLIAEGKWQSPYRYVLVDEFQDISAARLNLLVALKRPGTAYFLVGDDWQSIYRFTGSDIGLMQQCGDYLGHIARCDLTRTFRYGASIVSPTAAFIQRNPEQSKRILRPARLEPSDGITLIAAAKQSAGVEAALDDIRTRSPSAESASILVLGRYKSSRRNIPRQALHMNLRPEFSTVHSAKGREADYVIVLDLKDDRMGFPSQIEDDPLLQLVLPSATPFPHAEERRLFYVAMTRARFGVYLIARDELPSAFVEELRREEPDLRIINEFASDIGPGCPRCKGGSLVVSQSGRNLRCTNQPHCAQLVPRCSECGRGFVLLRAGTAKCSDARCAAEVECCPQCSIGVLRLIDGPYSKFWGCSEYYAEPPCAYRRSAEARASRR